MANPPRDIATACGAAIDKVPKNVTKAASRNPNPFHVIGRTVTIATIGKTEANGQNSNPVPTARETE